MWPLIEMGFVTVVVLALLRLVIEVVLPV